MRGAQLQIVSRGNIISIMLLPGNAFNSAPFIIHSLPHSEYLWSEYAKQGRCVHKQHEVWVTQKLAAVSMDHCSLSDAEGKGKRRIQWVTGRIRTRLLNVPFRTCDRGIFLLFRCLLWGLGWLKTVIVLAKELGIALPAQFTPSFLRFCILPFVSCVDSLERGYCVSTGRATSI